MEGINSLWLQADLTAGTGTLTLEKSIDATSATTGTWTTAVGYDLLFFDGSFDTNNITADGSWQMILSRAAWVRVRATACASCSWTIDWHGAQGPPDVSAAYIFGDASHDAADGDKAPAKIGARAISLGANPTGVSTTDRTNLYATRAGVLFVQPGHPNIITRECHVADADGAQTGTACVSVSAGTKIVVTGVEVACSAANTVNVNVRVALDTDSTLAASATTGTSGILLRHPAVPAGGGLSKGFAGGIVAIGADDEDLRYSMDDPVSGSCTVVASYYTIEG
jgi:hypothetical protein